MNKKNLTLIAGASMLVLGVPAASMAQTAAASGPFADVPADQWAYQAVDTLQKAGIVIGYPDGTYGGKRAMTRYEFAVAIARLLPLLQNQGAGNYATKDDLEALRQDLEQKLQANSDAIDALRKLVDEFQPELDKLGQDVSAVKDRLDALEARVAAVEEEQRRVRFTGTLSMIAKAVDVTKGPSFIDQNGVDTGNTADKHLLKTDDVYEDFLLGIKGKVSDTATANVAIDFGNYLNFIHNTDATESGTIGSLTAGNEMTTLWRANVVQPVDLGPLGASDLTAGRFGQQWTKWTLQQIDADVYTDLVQINDGDITTDGAKVKLDLGGIKVNAYAGQFKAVTVGQPLVGPDVIAGIPKQALGQGLIPTTASDPISQGAGVRATFGNPNNWVIGADFQTFGLGVVNTNPENGTEYGGEAVYGVDFNGAIPFIGKTGLKLDLNWNESALSTNPDNVNNAGNGNRYASTDDEIGYNFGALALKGGYEYVGPDYTAPGAWGRVGSWTNPTNIEGGVVSAKYTFSPKLGLNADYEGYQAAYGSNKDGTALVSPLQQSDKLNHYQVGLGYGLSSNYNLDLGYEMSQYDLKDKNLTLIAAGKPTQSYFNIGLDHTFNQNATFRLLYQIGQYRDKGTGYQGGGDADGNIAVGQFSVKF